MAHADDAATFFDDSVVQEIRIYFEAADWYGTLYDSHAEDPEDPYFPARFVSSGVVLYPIGVRFKGNSSFQIESVKKSFKLDFNEYDDDQTFLGLKKLNLHNGFKDPTMLREKLFLDFARRYIPAMRVVHTRVYVNDVYWGLYTAVEQVDKTFAERRFGQDEDGNLFKAQASDDGNPSSDFGSDLTWLGESQASYEERYQLKTNEEVNDYGQLMAFIDVLNNASDAALPSALEEIFDVPMALRALALNALFVNFDAYVTSAHNYYLYDRDDTGRLTLLLWDVNEAFGRFTMGLSWGDDPISLDPYWLPQATVPGVSGYPLAERLWAIEDCRTVYENALSQMLSNGFDAAAMGQRIQELAGIIREDVYADPNKQYSNSQFEENLAESIVEGSGPMGQTVHGLEDFVRQRAAYLNGVISPGGSPDVLVINEIMAANDSTLADEAGEFDDWIELYYRCESPVNLTGYTLTDDLSEPGKYRFPDQTIQGEGYLLIWADHDEVQGGNHAGFELSATAGERLGLYNPAGELMDVLLFAAQEADVSYGRETVDGTAWISYHQPTPGAANESGADDLLMGDANCDGGVNLADAICILSYIFNTGGNCGTPCCLALQDTNGDAKIDLADAVTLLGFLYSGESLDGTGEGWPGCSNAQTLTETDQ